MRGRLYVTGACLWLVGCGGSGNGGTSTVPVTSAPAPTPTPTPLPTGTPTPSATSPAAGPTLFTLQTSESLPGWSGSNGYHQASGGGVSYVQDLSIAAGYPVFYDAATRQFTFSGFDYLIPASQRGPVTFALVRSASTASYTEYRALARGVSYRFTELAQGGANPTLQLQYSGLAIIHAEYADPADGIVKHAVTPTAYGILFDWGKAKLTGAATYTGVLLGLARGVGSRVYDVRGTVRIGIDYATTEFTGSLKLTGTDVQTGRVVDLGDLTMVPSRPRGVLDYFYASTANDGRLQARLAGAQGEELTGGFDAVVADPQTDGAKMKVSLVLAARR